ncbi:hypothetical protein AMTR_s00099p00163300 [Amborella trichopoda]|uniref:NAC domain-containing protein n=2 Tax=Amborella trichopoda TaxID=13333 RepID=W1NYP6_AMBTC|nr:hypothetical protein AMTR_s00099p00163300 [Amborella trichopoda]
MNDAEKEGGEEVLMPGFRFHPTEEELVEFYLRRKVEGKRFSVELITFLDLYRYDPWELPAHAVIGEKEWFFYVPRDRKYRNGDRPNRVTTSGYWKATGADRMIRGERSSRPIGLKKTLVFYSGKAPKGTRSSWIMNEYRLPQHETTSADHNHHIFQKQKVEISLCRVYKRAGGEDLSTIPVPRFPTRLGNPSGRTALDENTRAIDHASDESLQFGGGDATPSSSSSSSTRVLHHQYNNLDNSMVTPPCNDTLLTLMAPTTTVAEELHRLVEYQQIYVQANQSQTSQSLLNTFSSSLPNLSDKLWEWNPVPEPSRDYYHFKEQ